MLNGEIDAEIFSNLIVNKLTFNAIASYFTPSTNFF